MIRHSYPNNTPHIRSDSKGDPLSVSGGKWPFGWTVLGVLAVSGFVWWLVSLALQGGA